jgi:hypothetical protein
LGTFRLSPGFPSPAFRHRFSIRVAVCGRKTAPPLFGTLEAFGRETCLRRLEQAIGKLKTS